MSKIRRRSAVLAALLSLAIVVLGSSPANAGTKYKTFYSPLGRDANAQFVIEAYPGGHPKGTINYGSSYPLATLLSVYVAQCDGLGHNCVTIASKQTQQLGAETVSTTAQGLYSPGHVYKTCGSVKDTAGWKLLDVCGPPTT